MLGLSSSTQSKMANELSRYTKKEKERERESFDISRSQQCIVVFCTSHGVVKRHRFSQ